MTSHNGLWGGHFHDRIDHSSISAFLHMREITMLSLSESLSNFHVDEIRAKETDEKKRRKGTINEGGKIEGVNGDKRIERKCHTETEYVQLLIGSETVTSEKFNFLYATCSFANKVSLAQKKSLHACIYTYARACTHASKNA